MDSNKSKEIDIKNRSCYCFDDLNIMRSKDSVFLLAVT